MTPQEAAELLAGSRRDLRDDAAAAWDAADRVVRAAQPGTKISRDALMLRAHAAFFDMRFTEALADLERVLPATQDADDATQVATAHLIFGKVHGRSERPVKALEHLEQARSHFQRGGDTENLYDVMLAIGNVHHSAGESTLAAEAYADALALARELGNHSHIANILNNLASIEQRFGRFDQARAYLTEAESIYRSEGSRGGVALVQFNIAEVQRAEGRLDGLIEFYEAALAGTRAVRNPFLTAACLRGIAETHILSGDFDAADHAWREALDIFAKLPLPGYEARLRTDYARHLLKHRRDPAAAERELNRADALQQDSPSIETRVNWLEARSHLLEHQGQLGEAVACLRELRQTDAKLQADQGRRRLEVLGVLHRVAQSQREAEVARRHGEELATALAEAERQRQLAEAANRFKADMLRMAAHDLRAPMGAVVGFLSIAREDLAAAGTCDPETLEILSDAETSAQRSIQTLSRLLDTALADSQSLQLRREEIDPLKLAQDVAREFRTFASAKSQSITVEGPSGLSLNGDRILLAEVLQNLVVNAVKFGPPGQRIRIRLTPASEHLEVRVDDEGPGLQPEDVKRLFEPFFRGSARPTDNEPSTGLGLALVRGIVEAHDGSVGAEPRDPGPGASFWIRLPWVV